MITCGSKKLQHHKTHAAKKLDYNFKWYYYSNCTTYNSSILDTQHN